MKIQSYCLTPDDASPLPLVPGIRRHVVPCRPYCSATLLYLCDARNRCVEDFLNGDADFLHFVDSDIEFQQHSVAGNNIADALEYQAKLFDKPGVVIGGKYQMSGKENACAVDPWGRYLPMHTTGIKVVVWTGAGWMMIHRAALTETKSPWFRLMAGNTNCPEDVGFCMQHFGDIFFDGDISLVHHWRNP